MDQQTSSVKNGETQDIDRKPASPCIMVIFGAAGDLTKRLLFPAVCNLGESGLLNKNFSIIGVAREKYDDNSFREYMEKNVDTYVKDDAAKEYSKQIMKNFHYICGDFADPNVYSTLKSKLSELQSQGFSANCMFYFAAPPRFMKTIATELHKAELLNQDESKAFKRIVVEKPFGHDLASAKELNKLLLSYADESQIFRIDHFLGKETVQNILAFRFSNGLFEPLWNRMHIDHVQITVSEQLGVESRGNYYEHSGALRDMVPNHLFQLLALITMEPPPSFAGHNIQAEKAKALRTVQVLKEDKIKESVVRGQYGAGIIDNNKMIDYRSEKNVDPKSNIETFTAMRLCINNWRWLHVPFYLRTGKRMPRRRSEIIVQFRSGPASLFNASEKDIVSNTLFIILQPDEGISLRFNAKIPGPVIKVEPVEMKFKYEDYFKIHVQTGYEMILYDCMNGEQMLFANAKTVEAGWTIVQPILDAWSSADPTCFPNYQAGSWGPKEADELLQKDGRKWLLC